MRVSSLFRPLPIVLALQAIFAAPGYSAGFTVGAGVADTTAKTLTGDGVVAATGSLTTSGSAIAVTVGTGTSSITNSGTINQTGTGRAIDANTGTPVLTITNNAGGIISATGSDVIRLNRAAGSYIINNQGTISQTGALVNGSRAIKADAAYTSTNNQIINGSVSNTAAVISSNGNDAIRLGNNFTLTNYGSIFSNGTVNTSCPDYMGTACVLDYSAADGVAIENARSNVVILNYGSITGPRHAIDGGDPVAASADSDLLGVDQLIVTSTGPNGVTFDKVVNGVTTNGVKIVDTVVINYEGGTLTGNNGSGVGLDGHGVVINYGTITGQYAGAGNVYDHEGAGLTTSNGDGDGVDIDGVAYVENYGTIRGLGAGGLDSGGNPNGADGIAAGGGTFINHEGAEIYGLSKGILIDDGANGTTASVRGTTTSSGGAAKIVNDGTITAEQKTAIGLVGNYNDSITNGATGVITGGAGSVRVDALASTTAAAAIQMGAGDDSLINSGHITGLNNLAIDMGDGNDTTQLLAGGTTGVIVGTVDGGAGTDTLQTSGTQTFAYGTITGFENFVVLNGTTNFNYGLGAVTDFQVDSGATLLVDGALSATGNVTIDGTFKTTEANTIRTINVDGNFSQGSTSNLQIGVGDNNTSDKFVVTGTGIIANGATITPVQKGSYVANGATYTIFSATGGLTVSAASLNVTDTIWIDYSLSTSGNDLILSAARLASYSGIAASGLGSLGTTLDSLGASGNGSVGSLLTALDALTTRQQVNDAISQVAPETNGATQQATQVGVNTVFSAFENRIDNARIASLSQGQSGISAGESEGRHIWMQGLGGWGTQDPRSGATGYDIYAYGLAAGLESDLSANQMAGVSAGYTKARASGISTAEGDDVDVDSYHLGGYYSVNNPDMTIDATLVAGFNSFESKRNVVFLGFNQTANGDYDGWQIGSRIELGFPFKIDSALSGRWLVGARASYLQTDGYTEQGNAAVTQRVDSNGSNSYQSVLGTELNYAASSSSALQLRVRYLHEFADSTDVTATFVAGGSSFTVAGVEPNRDALQIGAAYRLATNGGTLVTVGYDAEIKEDYLAHQLSARAIWAF